MKVSEPSIAFAVEAKAATTKTAWATRSTNCSEEDLSLRFYRDPQTKEFHRRDRPAACRNRRQPSEKRYAVDVALKAPKIPYRETIRGTADASQETNRWSRPVRRLLDPHGAPLLRGAKFEFVNDIHGGFDSQKLYPGCGKRDNRHRRAGIPGWLPDGRFQGHRL